jgi:hypothetical protein
MSFTRQMYGSCATKKHYEESTGVLDHQMDPNRYYNCNPCRVAVGLVGGNNVSLYDGNLVDLESEFRGLTRQNTYCPAGHYLPGTVIQGVDAMACGAKCGQMGLPCGSINCRKEKLHHLPECNIIHHRPRQTNVGYDLKFKPCQTWGTVPNLGRKNKKRQNTLLPLEWLNDKVESAWARY